MPVAKSIVEQASCLLQRAGSSAHPTTGLINCETGILPVAKKILI